MTDIFALQDDIVRDIVKSLRVRLAGEDEARLTKKGTTSPEAYQLYMRGKFELEKFTSNGLQTAIVHLQQAIQQDPAYAHAYAEMARAHIFLAMLSALPMAEAFARARPLAVRAVALDDTSGLAHFALGAIKWQADWDSPGAEVEFRRGLELEPADRSSVARPHPAHRGRQRFEGVTDRAHAPRPPRRHPADHAAAELASRIEDLAPQRRDDVTVRARSLRLEFGRN